ncbi:MAG: hypothetical protein KAR54_03110 [Candidatus Pacebacteria bacterium]|nr:hypothetical protein [Candidatus Paceibacterota bacterium]
MTCKIVHYLISLDREKVKLKVPFGSKLFGLQPYRCNKISILALVDDSQKKSETKTLYITKEGKSIPHNLNDLKPIGEGICILQNDVPLCIFELIVR